MILICSLGISPDTCDKQSAQDVLWVRVEPILCALGSESVVAEMPGDRVQGHFLKVVCGRKE
jgi:hypothetical protein